MNILVHSLLDNRNNEINSIIQSKEIICPKCLEIINIKIDNYKISLYDCKNGHKINDINFKDFPITQKIDLKNIICNDKCNQNNKFNSYNNQFYNVSHVVKIYVLYANPNTIKVIKLLIMISVILYVKFISSLIIHIVKPVKKIYA